MKEVEIWDYVIRWAIAQNGKLGEKDVSEWSGDEFTKIKETLDDIILSIRFDQMSSEEFYNKVRPYKKIFDKDIYKEIKTYHLAGGNWKTITPKGSRAN